MVYKMSNKLYTSLISDQKDEKGNVISRGCKNKKGVIEYINSTYGLLHTVTDIQIG